MKTITDLYEFEDSKITLLAVDESGKYYTEDGKQGLLRDTYHFENIQLGFKVVRLLITMVYIRICRS